MPFPSIWLFLRANSPLWIRAKSFFVATLWVLDQEKLLQLDEHCGFVYSHLKKNQMIWFPLTALMHLLFLPRVSEGPGAYPGYLRGRCVVRPLSLTSSLGCVLKRRLNPLHHLVGFRFSCATCGSSNGAGVSAFGPQPVPGWHHSHLHQRKNSPSSRHAMRGPQ